MAKSGGSAVLNLGEIGEEGLNFQPSSATTHSFESKVPDSALDAEDDDDQVDAANDRAQLLGGESGSGGGSGGRKRSRVMNFFSISFYGQFFDVDTEDVRKRLTWSVTPRPGFTSSFVRTAIRSNPDLYGPFWVCVTLIFSVAISGNVASYLQAAFKTGDEVKGFRWHYDFHKVTLAATAVFGYALLVPAGLYAALWHQSSSSSGGSVSITELLCVYGYSLAVFIPVSVLWTIQSSALQWSLVLVGAGISGAVLVLSLWSNAIKDNVRKNVAFVLIAVIVALHMLLACGFMLYFFHAPSTAVVVAVADGKSTEKPAVEPPKQDGRKAGGDVPDSPPKVDGEEAKKIEDKGGSQDEKKDSDGAAKEKDAASADNKESKRDAADPEKKAEAVKEEPTAKGAEPKVGDV